MGGMSETGSWGGCAEGRGGSWDKERRMEENFGDRTRSSPGHLSDYDM